MILETLKTNTDRNTIRFLKAETLNLLQKIGETRKR
nr:MAG TPA: hypothetical protein [Caudoviricetes sp.]